ncbi:MAG: TatD family hydrolase [Desulfuromusa sp.]|nr:TatD family hydrolase [Desulfuromusa sp.]
MISLIDTHIHLDAPELKGTGLGFLPEAQKYGISKFVVPGVRVSGWTGMVALAENNKSVYLAPGVHPAYADQWTPEAEQRLQKMTASPKVVAIGEIGLDGSVGPSLQQQEVVLRGQLQLALNARLPVLLHARQATGRLLAILRELEVGKKIGGIWHGFSGSLPVAQELAELGFKIGVGPILLRANVRKLPDAVRVLPASALVLETDLPDMAEKPEILLKVAEKVAELRHCSLEETARSTTENVNKLFAFQDRSIYGR